MTKAWVKRMIWFFGVWNSFSLETALTGHDFPIVMTWDILIVYALIIFGPLFFLKDDSEKPIINKDIGKPSP